MKLYYICECCQQLLSEIEMDEVDSLTPQGRQDIISMNQGISEIYINSLCAECINALGLEGQEGYY